MTEHRPRASVTTSKNARRSAFGDARLRLPSVRRAEANKGAVSADPAEQPDPVRSVGSLDPAALPAKPTIEGSALGRALEDGPATNALADLRGVLQAEHVGCARDGLACRRVQANGGDRAAADPVRTAVLIA